MSRLLLVVACAFALTFAAPVTSDSSALAAKAKAAAAKTCRAKAPSGKNMTWRCGKDQACCIDMSGKGVCGMPGIGCF